MVKLTALIALCAIFATALASGKRKTRPRRDPCRIAFKRCDWRFKDRFSLQAFDISGPADKAFTPLIVAKNPAIRLGVLNTNHIIPEFINDDGSITPITFEGHPPLTPTHFKPFSIRGTVGSGVGRQSFDGNQKRVASGRCVRIFFSQYQKLGGSHPPFVIDNINVKKSDNKCVVFRTF